jgi:DNA modification methylase
MKNIIEFGDCRETMRRWSSQGIKAQTCVTSPPYFGLRDYGTARWEGGDPNCNHVGKDSRTVSGGAGKQYTNAGSNRVYSGDCICGARRIDSQIGLEETPEDYIAAMVDVFRCVRDVLADDGTLWLNIGDSYYNYRPGKGQALVKQSVSSTKQDLPDVCARRGNVLPGIKEKDLIGIPWMLAFALRADGWYLRQDIIWHKPNPMPESVRDRCTKAHEYVFLLSKAERYFFDSEAMKEPAVCAGKVGGAFIGRQGTADYHAQSGGVGSGAKDYQFRNRRSVWTVATRPYKGAHFATYPPELIEPCILAGSRVGDTVLDPFMGSGTTAAVSVKHGRRYLGCELNTAYKELQNARIGAPKLIDLFDQPI